MAHFTADLKCFFIVGIVVAVTHYFITGVTVNACHAFGMMDVVGKFKIKPVTGQSF